MQITNRNIVLTGAAAGIGRALLNQLITYKGVSIMCVDLKEVQLLKTIAELPPSDARVLSYACDVSSPDAIDDLFDHALRQMGSIDIFFANAGFAYYEQFPAPDWQHIESLFRVNTLSPLYSFQKMREMNQGREYFMMITASAMAKTAIPGFALYGASKAALHRFADAYRYEHNDLGHLSLIHPISTRTSFFEHAAPPGTENTAPIPLPFPVQRPEAVAQAMVKGVLNNQKFIYPSLFHYTVSFFQHLAELLMVPYQLFYSKAFWKWKSQGK